MDVAVVPLLSSLEPSAFERLMARSVTRSLPRGRVLFLSGEARARAHFVLDGSFFLLRRDPSGAESVNGFATRGRLLDEIGTVDGEPHTCDAIAASDAIVLGVDASALRDELDRSVPLAKELARQLEARLRWMTTAATERASCRVAGRVAGRLLDLASQLGEERGGVIEFDLPVQQEQLALLAGTTRESACKTMRALKDKGVLDYRGRRLRILRPDALDYLRCGERAAGPSPSGGAGVRRRSRSRSGT
ncbi:MAG: Crp/Fnr family transcriptional regulator [Actinomycetota bacterium]|nr:Crp/Fnr family transcriptional regulator [Actinomycetota bacterium]